MSELDNLQELTELLRGKVSKRSVGYGHGVSHRKCALCVMWRPPHACTLVAGRIEAGGVCEKFERKGAANEREEVG